MKYLCLVYTDEHTLAALPEPEWRNLVESCQAHGAALRAQGVQLAGEVLQSVDTATTLRLRHGRLSIADGPFAETKEQLAGFCLIEADGLHDALHLAADMPAARLGCIEVRPVLALQPGVVRPAPLEAIEPKNFRTPVEFATPHSTIS